MFELTTGGMRSGKSYRLTKLALEAIEQGRLVCTDIPLNIIDCPTLYQWEWTALTDVFATEQERFERYPYLAIGGVLYLLDEGWKGLKSGDRTIANNLQLMSFFREHGQFINEDGLSNDIVLCTQNFKSINSQLRELADKTVLCVKPTGIGVKNMSLNYHIDGAWGTLRPPRGSNKDLILKIDRVFLNPEVYKCYNSHAKTAAKDGINKGGFDKEGTQSNETVFHSWSFRFSIVVGLFAIWFVANNVMAFSDSLQSPTKASTHERDITSHANGIKNPINLDAKETKDTADNLSLVNKSSDSNDNRTGHISDTLSTSSGNGLSSSKSSDINQNSHLSDKWRVASVIQNKRTKDWFVYLVDNKGNLKRINPSLCTHDEFGQVECVMNGESVTKFSGSKVAKTDGIPSIFASK
ncbi:MAG: zonular occludens toxin domain-containing protein [Methylococcaceae bacterium]|nr:zonular occludens toxin domain-containing protein [Methylococcaceae bacterium]